jgi:hypothetical protein
MPQEYAALFMPQTIDIDDFYAMKSHQLSYTQEMSEQKSLDVFKQRIVIAKDYTRHIQTVIQQ